MAMSAEYYAMKDATITSRHAAAMAIISRNLP